MAIAPQLQNAEVVLGWLAELKFPAGWQRAWTGGYELTTVDGRVWQPVSKWGKVTVLESQSATVSASFTLSLTRPHVAAGQGNPANNVKQFNAALKKDWDADIRGGEAALLVQIFQRSTGKLIGKPRVLAAGRMSPLRVTADAATADVQVEVSGILADGSSAPNRFVTDEDQQTAHAGDRIFEFVPQLQTRTLRWPKTK